MAAYFFVAADAGEVGACAAGNGGGELAAFLQGFAAVAGGALALFPFVTAPAFIFEVVFCEGNELGGDAAHHGAVVGGVFEQLGKAAL